MIAALVAASADVRGANSGPEGSRTVPARAAGRGRPAAAELELRTPTLSLLPVQLLDRLLQHFAHASAFGTLAVDTDHRLGP